MRATRSNRLLGKQGSAANRPRDALCNSFSEGFDIADLKDAKALLYELSA